MLQSKLTERVDPLNAKVDVVFVHGPKPDIWASWFEDFLPQEIPEARILSFKYDASVAEFSASWIEKIAIDLCEKLAGLRSKTNTVKSPVIFVAHSLGGLVCAKALVMGYKSSSSNTRLIAKNVRGMVLLATPSPGVGKAAWKEKMVRIVNLHYQTEVSDVEDFKEESGTIWVHLQPFLEILKKPKDSKESVEAVFFYGKPGANGNMIIHQDSTWVPSDAAPIDADHSIFQFKTGEEEGYNLVSTALKNLIEKEIGAGTSGQDGGYEVNNFATVHNQVNGTQNVDRMVFGPKGSEES